MLETLELIRKTPSDTIQEVKEKDYLFRKRFQPLCTPFRKVGSLWCSYFFLDPKASLNPQEYKAALDLLGQTNKLNRLLEESPYREAIAICDQAQAVFHWQLEFPQVFFGRSRWGFDAIIGNPPYDVLSEKETGHDISPLKVFAKQVPGYRPSIIGKNNLYKLFICRALSFLADEGRLGFITPMPLLGDEQASGIRKEILRLGTIDLIDAFPQKDDPKKRVFRDAKLSTAVMIVCKTLSTEKKNAPFVIRVHPANKIEQNSPSLKLSAAEIPEYDPVNMTIVSCSQTDWNLAVRLMHSGRLVRLAGYCKSFQGEVNETNEKSKGLLATEPPGPLVLRGSNVCLYILREASQGEDLYIRETGFFEGKSEDAKAFHSKQERIGFQRSSPQNNFRRLVACWIPPVKYCFDTISYVPLSESKLALPLVLALLNSKLLDWYFRLGSTNSKVNEYQFAILPCPLFSLNDLGSEPHTLNSIFSAIDSRQEERALQILAPYLVEPPFSRVVSETIVRLTRKIMAIEEKRGEIARAERSSLAPEAQRLQELVDNIIYRLAGLGDEEVLGLEQRLKQML